MRFARASFLLVSAFISSTGCGSKTGLIVPDIAHPPIDATDAPDLVCVPGTIPLVRSTADVMLLVDRSNSMRLNLDGMTDVLPTRWQVLDQALQRALPPLESTLSFGAVFFPRPPTQPNPPIEDLCGVLSDIDIAPGLNHANAILQVFQRTQPSGGTPTFLGLQLIRQWFDAHPGGRDPRYVVLATDGGPNCNLDLDFTTCDCTSRDARTGLPNCADAMSPVNCLDDRRTLIEIGRLVSSGAPVFVIGIDDPTRPDLRDVLTRMAIQGGRPNMTSMGPSFYSVRSPSDLDNAFTAIERTIAQCTFTTATPPPNFDTIRVLLGGNEELARDTSHTNGWDVTDRSAGEITLFGSACDRIARDANAMLTVRFGCEDGG
jgi:hypothetical protein